MLGAAALAWLLAQLPRATGPTRLRLIDEPKTRAQIAARTLTYTIENEVTAFHGVAATRAHLTGAGYAPHLNMVITTDPSANLPDLRTQGPRPDHAQPRHCTRSPPTDTSSPRVPDDSPEAAAYPVGAPSPRDTWLEGDAR